MSFLLGILNMLFGGAAQIIKAMGPPAVVVEAEKAGSATALLNQVEASDAKDEQADTAVAHVSDVVATDGGLRNVEQADPNNRANWPT